MKNTSYFNANWSEKQINDAINTGYREAIQKGITDGSYTFTYAGETVTVAVKNGNFKTAYGNYRYSYEELLALLD